MRELERGDEAYVIVLDAPRGKSKSGARRVVLGSGRVRVLERQGDMYLVTLTRFSSGPWGTVRVGDMLQFARGELHDVRSKVEALAFRERVERLWGDDVQRGSYVRARRG